MPLNEIDEEFEAAVRATEQRIRREQERIRAERDAQVPPPPEPPRGVNPVRTLEQELRFTNTGLFINTGAPATAEGLVQPAIPVDWNDLAEVQVVKKTKEKPKVIEDDPRLKVPEMSTRARRFRPQYENVDEWRLRLNNSIVTLYDKPMFVQEVMMARDTTTHQYGLCAIAYDSRGKQEYHLLVNHGMNLRAVDPGYIDMPTRGVYYLYRIPARVYKQGNTRENTRIVRPGGEGGSPWSRDDSQEMLKALENRKVFKYDPKLAEEITRTYGKVERYPAVRLCDALAYHIEHPAEARNGSRITLNYKGRHLGSVVGTTAIIGMCDIDKPWIRRTLERVGLAYEVEK